MKQLDDNYPQLNQRAVGWLNFLHQKATTPDDWTEEGDPHESVSYTHLTLPTTPYV